MLTTEIVLIVLGFISICLSFFVANKKKQDNADEENMVRTADIWTEKDEEVVIRHINEILEERGMELVETTEDQMNRICNEKIMAIDEFTKPLLDKIHVNHEEVVFMYNMLGEKQKEIQKQKMEETLQTAVPTITPISDEKTVPPVSSRPVQDETPPEEVEKSGRQKPAPAPAPVPAPKPKPTGLERAHRRTEAAIVPPVQAPGSDELVKPSVHRQEVVGDSRGTQVRTSLSGIDQAKVQMQRPSKETVMHEIQDPTGVRERDVEDRVRILYKQGKSVVDISKELNIGQGEVKLMIAMYKKRS